MPRVGSLMNASNRKVNSSILEAEMVRNRPGIYRKTDFDYRVAWAPRSCAQSDHLKITCGAISIILRSHGSRSAWFTFLAGDAAHSAVVTSGSDSTVVKPNFNCFDRNSNSSQEEKRQAWACDKDFQLKSVTPLTWAGHDPLSLKSDQPKVSTN